jgi:hypothetical protein
VSYFEASLKMKLNAGLLELEDYSQMPKLLVRDGG